MSLLLTLAFATQAAMTPTPVVPTLENQTREGYDVQCSVSDPKGLQRRVNLRQSGGRGYANTSADGMSYIGQTRYDVIALLDETGLFKGRTSVSPLIPSYGPGTIMSDDKIPEQPDSKVQILLKETSGGRHSISIASHWPVGAVDFIGFCDVRPFDQQPLTKEETKAYLAS